MKTPLILLVAIVFVIGCTPDEHREVAEQSPHLAPTTRATQHVQQQIDPIAQQGETLSRAVRSVAAEAASVGVPGAGLVAAIAGAVGTILGAYNERRKGTLPLKNAITQIVQSVESAFPTKNESQKSAMASVQDQATKRIVDGVKGS